MKIGTLIIKNPSYLNDDEPKKHQTHTTGLIVHETTLSGVIYNLLPCTKTCRRYKLLYFEAFWKD